MKPPSKRMKKEVLGGRWDFSEQEGSLSFSKEEGARQENSTRGPAHDKTKRLNDLWMWLSILPSALAQLRGLLPPSGGQEYIPEQIKLLSCSQVFICSSCSGLFTWPNVQKLPSRWYADPWCNKPFAPSTVWKDKSNYTLNSLNMYSVHVTVSHFTNI